MQLGDTAGRPAADNHQQIVIRGELRMHIVDHRQTGSTGRFHQHPVIVQKACAGIDRRPIRYQQTLYSMFAGAPQCLVTDLFCTQR